MKVTVVSCVYPPEPVVSARTSQSIVSFLLERGHQVTVITSIPSRPEGKIFSGFNRTLFSRVQPQASYFVIRCFSFASPTSSIFSRWLENVSFGITSSLALLFTTESDVVYINSWPIFAVGLNSLICKIRKIPIVFSIQDLYPESLVLQKRIEQDHWIYKLLLRIDRWIAQQAHSIILVSQKFYDSFHKTRNIPDSKLQVVPNWIDVNAVELLDKTSCRTKLGIQDRAFVLVYGGNIGNAAGLENILETLRDYRGERDLVFIIAGSGSNLLACQKMANNIKQVNILFNSPWAENETSSILAVADVLLLPTNGSQSLTSVPSKLLTYMLAAKPILAIVLPESDSAQVIEESGCGWVVQPGNSDILLLKLQELSQTPECKLEQMGALGREYVIKNFSTERSVPQVIQRLEKFMRGSLVDC